LTLQESGDRPTAVAMITNVGIETVEFTTPLKLNGKVENYMQDIINVMRSSLRDVAGLSLIKLAKHGKTAWLSMDPAQTTLLINMLNWTKDVEAGFAGIKNDKESMKKCWANQVTLLSDLIKMV
jgi:dynein heavy chain